MEFSIEKYITPFIESQFPQFYQEDGPNFILFVKSYYEWLQETGNPIYESRNLLNYRDIDNTIDEFIEYFQKKYLYGIPFNVIINKRYLLKHILDVYRSKSSIQCYKLLFRLIYNEDVDIYLPGRDILKPSDGTWYEPTYLEVSDTGILNTYVGKNIIGLSSNTTALVESYIKEPINQNIISSLYISNIKPKGGAFVQGEKVLIQNNINANTISEAPTVLGSLSSVKIINGGQGFNIGDNIKIVYRDLSNNDVISYGVDGLLKVESLTRSSGSINFNILNGGFGFTSNSLIFIYNNASDNTGIGATFTLGALSSTKSIEYNSDLIIDYYNQTLNSSSFGFPANTSANVSSNLINVFTYQNSIFGSILSLTNIKTGNGYTQPVNTFIRSTLLSNTLVGNVSYNTTSNTVTGTNTLFTTYFNNNDVICLISNSSNTSTAEYQIIKTVDSNTSITLYGPPNKNSTSSAVYKAAPVILPSNFALSDTIMFRPDGTINGKNDIITGYSSSGNDIIATVKSINSGKGYVDGEFVKMYLYGGVNTPTIVSGGSNYSNGDLLVFSGGGTFSSANGFVTTNSTGGVISTTLSYQGSGYTSIPVIKVKSTNGSGAYLTTTLTEYNTFSEVLGTVIKSGVGKQRGYWTTTRSFLNSDKYIQDSYFYQDFSYQIKTAVMLDKYKNILYNTFHTSGTELFGEYDKNLSESSNNIILYEQTQATLS